MTRRVMARVLSALVLTALCSSAFALDPALDAQQYSHTAWRAREGFGRGWIHVLAQTPDGYLWFGTEFGLLRFDGVRVTAWQPPKGKSLPGNLVINLLTGRDGRLWIATGGGLASWHAGELTNYRQFDGWAMYGLQEDRKGTVWITARNANTRAMICAIRGEEVDCDGADGRLGDWLGGLFADSAGRLWVCARDGVWRWSPGPPQFLAIPGTYDSTQSMTEDEDGALLVATRNGMFKVSDGKVSPYLTVPMLSASRSTKLLRDRHGSVWIGATEAGLAHLHRGRLDFFTKAHGLTSDYVGRIFEDREGSIWVSTREGLDRFRELAVPTFGKNQGLLTDSNGSLLVTRDGTVWIGSPLGLDHWHDGAFDHIHARGMPMEAGTLFEDSRGRIWNGSSSQVGYLETGRWLPVDIAPGYIDGISEDPSGNIWLAHRSQGLLRISPSGSISRWDWSAFGRQDFASRLAVDPGNGSVWLGFYAGGIAQVVDGRVVAKFSDADGLGKGRVYFLRVDPDATLWVGNVGGLSRIRKHRVVTLDRSSGLPCSAVKWMIDDALGNTWISTACGAMRVPRNALEQWLLERERGESASALPVAVYSDSDGVRSEENVSSFSPHVGRTPDGRLWYVASDGIGVIDPSHLAPNPLPPLVHITGLVANRVTHDLGLSTSPQKLPPLVRDLEIEYTALSLVAPEKMKFRYRLEGRDKNWQDAGARRTAFYSDLDPGHYRFQVVASNNDGVWNNRGASLEFTIAPTFYQTSWFIAACVIVVLLLLWLLYAVRIRRLESRAQLRFEERVAERERIARDLHDTFLQSVQGLILKFHAAMTRLPQEVPTRRMLEQALERADAVVTEGRNRVYGLRDSSQAVDLAQALAQVAQEHSQDTETEFRLTVQGTTRALHPLVREEAFRIGAEALVNAFRHAKARRIDLEIEYSRKELSVRVTDDGRGFDVNALDTLPGQRHFGLAGLSERARRLRSQLQVSSRVGSGSAVELRVPGAIAYAATRETPGPRSE